MSQPTDLSMAFDILKNDGGDTAQDFLNRLDTASLRRLQRLVDQMDVVFYRLMQDRKFTRLTSSDDYES